MHGTLTHSFNRLDEFHDRLKESLENSKVKTKSLFSFKYNDPVNFHFHNSPQNELLEKQLRHNF